MEMTSARIPITVDYVRDVPLPRFGREISVLYADLIDGPSHNSNWIVVHETAPEFAALAAKHPGAVRNVVDAAAYGDCRAYDFNGPVAL